MAGGKQRKKGWNPFKRSHRRQKVNEDEQALDSYESSVFSRSLDSSKMDNFSVTSMRDESDNDRGQAFCDAKEEMSGEAPSSPAVEEEPRDLTQQDSSWDPKTPSQGPSMSFESPFKSAVEVDLDGPSFFMDSYLPNTLLENGMGGIPEVALDPRLLRNEDSQADFEDFESVDFNPDSSHSIASTPTSVRAINEDDLMDDSLSAMSGKENGFHDPDLSEYKSPLNQDGHKEFFSEYDGGESEDLTATGHFPLSPSENVDQNFIERDAQEDSKGIEKHNHQRNATLADKRRKGRPFRSRLKNVLANKALTNLTQNTNVLSPSVASTRSANIDSPHNRKRDSAPLAVATTTNLTTTPRSKKLWSKTKVTPKSAETEGHADAKKSWSQLLRSPQHATNKRNETQSSPGTPGTPGTPTVDGSNSTTSRETEDVDTVDCEPLNIAFPTILAHAQTFSHYQSRTPRSIVESKSANPALDLDEDAFTCNTEVTEITETIEVESKASRAVSIMATSVIEDKEEESQQQTPIKSSTSISPLGKGHTDVGEEQPPPPPPPPQSSAPPKLVIVKQKSNEDQAAIKDSSGESNEKKEQQQGCDSMKQTDKKEKKQDSLFEPSQFEIFPALTTNESMCGKSQEVISLRASESAIGFTLSEKERIDGTAKLKKGDLSVDQARSLDQKDSEVSEYTLSQYVSDLSGNASCDEDTKKLSQCHSGLSLNASSSDEHDKKQRKKISMGRMLFLKKRKKKSFPLPRHPSPDTIDEEEGEAEETPLVGWFDSQNSRSSDAADDISKKGSSDPWTSSYDVDDAGQVEVKDGRKTSSASSSGLIKVGPSRRSNLIYWSHSTDNLEVVKVASNRIGAEDGSVATGNGYSVPKKQTKPANKPTPEKLKTIANTLKQSSSLESRELQISASSASSAQTRNGDKGPRGVAVGSPSPRTAGILAMLEKPSVEYKPSKIGDTIAADIVESQCSTLSDSSGTGTDTDGTDGSASCGSSYSAGSEHSANSESAIMSTTSDLGISKTATFVSPEPLLTKTTASVSASQDTVPQSASDSDEDVFSRIEDDEDDSVDEGRTAFFQGTVNGPNLLSACTPCHAEVPVRRRRRNDKVSRTNSLVDGEISSSSSGEYSSSDSRSEVDNIEAHMQMAQEWLSKISSAFLGNDDDDDSTVVNSTIANTLQCEYAGVLGRFKINVNKNNKE